MRRWNFRQSVTHFLWCESFWTCLDTDRRLFSRPMRFLHTIARACSLGQQPNFRHLINAQSPHMAARAQRVVLLPARGYAHEPG
jgi:hypothetical protein